MKKVIIFFAILMLLSSISWARMQTAPIEQREVTSPTLVRSDVFQTFPEGVTPRRTPEATRAPIFDDYQQQNTRDRAGIAYVWYDAFEPEDEIWNFGGPAYFWYVPTDVPECATRFTTYQTGTIAGAYFYFYGGDATAIDVHVHDDDNAGLPGTVLGSVTGVAVTTGGYHYVDLSSLAISVTTGEDFFISFEVNGAGDIWIVSDDGSLTSGVQHSSYWNGAAWAHTDYEWCIVGLVTKDESWDDTFGWWYDVTDNPFSGSHSWWMSEEITGSYRKDFVVSPTFTFDPDVNYNVYYFSFMVDPELMRCGIPTGPGSIDEYYEVWICDTDAGVYDWWHIDSFNAYSGNSWWCGAPDIYGWPGGWGYGNNWNQWVQTPNISLPTDRSLYLDFMHRYDTEPGYDYCYVEITTDNWASYDVLAAYDDISNTWAAVQIDISAYAGENASIRFRFESDTGWSDEDGDYLSEGAWFIDDVSVNDGTRTTYFIDDADTNVNFLVNPGNIEWTNLFYDYDRDYPNPSLGYELVDNNYIYNGTVNLTPWVGSNVKLRVSCQIDDGVDEPWLEGAGIYIDDIMIQGISLPQFDTQCDFVVVPYPTTEGMSRDLMDPKIIYHQGGWGTSGANGYVDVEGLGLAYPLFDYRESGMPELAMFEYGMEDLTYQSSQYTPEAGTFNFKGWVDGAAARADNFADDNFIQISPPGEYEIGYNARVIGDYYYPDCDMGAVTLYTPFSDGHFTAGPYYIDGIGHMIYNRGLDYGTPDTLTFTVYEAATPTTFGAQIYTEDIIFTIAPEERYMDTDSFCNSS